MKAEILLKEKLDNKGLSLRLLSRVSGVAYATVYSIFTGKKPVSDAYAGSIRKIAYALDMSMDTFYQEMEKANMVNQAHLLMEYQLC